MRVAGKALRLSIFVGDGDTWGRELVWREVVRRASAAGLAGASVFHGMQGYGTHYRIHSRRVFAMSKDLPVAIIIVDAEDSIREFLPQIDEIVTSGLVTLDPVEVLIRYAGDGRDRSGVDAGSM
jgi:PII-like signaling protein